MSIKLGLYRHFKGGMYEVIGVAKHSETMEDMVVYRHIDTQASNTGTNTNGLYVRPLSMWNEIVERDGKRSIRFEYIGDET